MDRDEDRPLALAVVAMARSVPALLVALVAFAGVVAYDLPPRTVAPVALALILIGQVVGLAIARVNDLTPWATAFALNLATLAVVLPLLAIQATATRSPHVSTEFGTARPAIIATVAAIVALVIVGIVSISCAFAEPEGPSLAFAPASFLVPAMLGAGPTLSEREVATRLIEVFGLTAAATFIAILVSDRLKLVIGPVSLAIFFGYLIATDRGPTIEPTSSEIARVLDGALLAVTVFIAIVLPLISIGVRRVMRSVDAMERTMLLERVGRRS